MLAALALGGLLAAASAYYLAGLAAAVRFGREARGAPPGPAAPEGVSVLKPAAGADEGFTALLRSHASQDWHEFEILVGTGPGDESARAAVRQVRNEFPGRRIEAIECPRPTPGCNGKVEVLERLARHARHPVLVVSDADIEVFPGYLRTICSELAAAGTGMVTCLYGAGAPGGPASRLQAARINAEFPLQVLLARQLQGLRFALGSTLALRAETLQRIGGFESVRRFIGDDYQLGARVADKGLQVALSRSRVRTRLPANDGWRAAWQRELRWSRTIRKQRPRGHAALPVTFATLWSVLGVAAFADSLSWLAGACLALRLAAAASVLINVNPGTKHALRDLCWVPASDFWAYSAWIASHFGNSVTWAGRQLRLGPGGRIMARDRREPRGRHSGCRSPNCV